MFTNCSPLFHRLPSATCRVALLDRPLVTNPGSIRMLSTSSLFLVLTSLTHRKSPDRSSQNASLHSGHSLISLSDEKLRGVKRRILHAIIPTLEISEATSFEIELHAESAPIYSNPRKATIITLRAWIKASIQLQYLQYHTSHRIKHQLSSNRNLATKNSLDTLVRCARFSDQEFLPGTDQIGLKPWTVRVAVMRISFDLTGHADER